MRDELCSIGVRLSKGTRPTTGDRPYILDGTTPACQVDSLFRLMPIGRNELRPLHGLMILSIDAQGAQ